MPPATVSPARVPWRTSQLSDIHQFAFEHIRDGRPGLFGTPQSGCDPAPEDSGTRHDRGTRHNVPMELHHRSPGSLTPAPQRRRQPTPAAVVSGEVPASEAAHPLSVFDLFHIGIGPSSSHTVGPMRAGLAFAAELAALPDHPTPSRLTVDLFGSLGATGRGHNTDRAVLLGLAGNAPESVDIATVEAVLPRVATSGTLALADGARVPLDVEADLRFLPRTVLPYHVNALTITALAAPDRGDPVSPSSILLRRTYYSVGGGFVMAQTNDDPDHPQVTSLATPDAARLTGLRVPHPFTTSADLVDLCVRRDLSVARLVRANEEAMRPACEVDAHLDAVADAMFDSIEAGTRASGLLPGGLDVPRRAGALAARLRERASHLREAGSLSWAGTPEDPLRAMDWVNLFALAVNEENASGHRIVTAPTNGAAGVVPAVLGYLVAFCPDAGGATPSFAPAPGARMFPVRFARPDEGGSGPANGPTSARRRRAVHDFLLTASAIGALIKTNASIAGAEVGCQGEVGSASAMAAGGLAQALGGTPRQVENAAEIAMEHSLGLTCDPVGGLVQIPCIERNAIAAVKAINAARIALWGDGRHTVSLDAVIETMRQTGNDMLSKYKETSAGGLAVNVVEC